MCVQMSGIMDRSHLFILFGGRFLLMFRVLLLPVFSGLIHRLSISPVTQFSVQQRKTSVHCHIRAGSVSSFHAFWLEVSFDVYGAASSCSFRNNPSAFDIAGDGFLGTAAEKKRTVPHTGEIGFYIPTYHFLSDQGRV